MGNRTNEPLTATEIEALYRRLSPEERDELLQCLLISGTRGGEAMIEVRKDLLLCHATEELLADMCKERLWGGEQ